MTGQASWITGAILLFGIAGIVALVSFAQQLGRGVRAVRRRVACPGLGKDCDCVLLQRTSDDRWVDVASCAAFDDPERVPCKKRCLAVVAAGAR